MAGELPLRNLGEGAKSPRATVEHPTNERADTLVDEAEKTGGDLLDADARNTARLGGSERPPGFARLSETSDEEKLWNDLDATEKVALIGAALKEQAEKPLTSHQQLALQKLAFLQTLAEELANTRMLVRPGLQFEAGLSGKPYKLKEWLKGNQTDLTLKIVGDDHFDLGSPDGIPADLRKVIEYYSGFKIENLRTEADIYAGYDRMITELRSAKEYERAQALMEQILSPELEAGRKQLGATWTHQIEAQADREVFGLYVDNQNAWRAAFREQFKQEFLAWHNAAGDTGPPPDASDARVEKAVMDYYESLRTLAHEHALNKQVAGFVLGKAVAIPDSKKAIYDQYVDMLDPKHEWGNIADETWDTIIRETAINAPLIIASGSVAALARRGLSEVTMDWLAREGAERLPVLWGKQFAEKTLLSRAISGTARVGMGLLTEGAIFDATHRALTGAMVRDLPDWGRSILWSSLTLGVFHGTGKITERLFTKTIGGLEYNTWLGEKIGGNITNKAVRETVRTLALKGHVEMATMLAIGAMQNAAYKGSLDEFWNNIGSEILHAYISVGALKIAGGATQKIQAFRAQRNRMPDELGLETRWQKSEVDEAAVLQKLKDPKVSRQEKGRIREAFWGKDLESRLILKQEVDEWAEIIKKKGLHQCAEDIANLDLQFSRVDGSPLRTRTERFAFMEKMKNLSKLELEWYKTRPEAPLPPKGRLDYKVGSPEHEVFHRKSNELKKFNAEFISQKLIPALIAKGTSLRSIILEVHRWQTRGSQAQLDILRSPDEYGHDIAGRFRECNMRVKDYFAPDASRAPELVTLFSRQMERLSSELLAKKGEVSPQEYEKAVVKLACYVQQTFIDIHPMRDGNGRTSRSLYEYVITKFLGPQNKYRQLPTEYSEYTKEPTMVAELIEFNARIAQRDYINPSQSPLEMQNTAERKLDFKLRSHGLAEVLGDTLISDFAERVIAMIDAR